MSTAAWYVHVWVWGHYSGAYPYDRYCDAVRHRNSSAAKLAPLGCRYLLSDRKKLK